MTLSQYFFFSPDMEALQKEKKVGLCKAVVSHIWENLEILIEQKNESKMTVTRT